MKKIYVVEDDEDIRYIVEYILMEDGYLIRTFNNASGFLGALKEPYPDLILLDIMLPDGDGRELCKIVKTGNKTNNIPVLMMSANVNVEEMADDAYADGFLQKPFDISELRKIVRSKIGGVI